MTKKILATALMILALLLTVGLSSGQEANLRVLADFEVDEIFEGRDQYNNAIGHAPWGDIAGNVVLSLAQMERVDVSSTVLAINYDIGAWGGFTQALTDGDNWISQDWTAYNALRFWLYGNNTGGLVQVEIFDNRNPNISGDSAERWYYRITDDYEGWREFTIEFRSFQRRSDWQPGGAPDDGLGLDAVSGLAFGFPAGAGAQTTYLDDVHLVTLDVQPLMLDDFEMDALFIGLDDAGNDIGYVTWGDAPGNVELSLFQAKRGGQESGALNVNFDIGAWGGFTHAFSDGAGWQSMDWTGHNAMQFWLYGNSSGRVVQIEIFDNRQMDSKADSAERFYYHLLDDYDGWRQFTIPFAFFQRRADWQPGGAPDDGFNLDAVWGYAFGFPAGVGAQTAYLDNLMIVVVDDPTQVRTAAGDSVTEVEVDESVGWDTREWQLLWSDEFDGEEAAPISSDSWTCEVGGHGWGNNELQYYTDRIENAAHDGAGNLVITAREETLDGASCHYGECLYTSARCITQDKVEFTYGRVEARINIPNGQGVWPAFWMLGANFPEIGWPLSGEIDILENVGEKNVVYGALHGPGYSGAGNIGHVYRADVNFDEGFHVYAIDWDEYVIRWYVNGELVNLTGVKDLEGAQWVYDHDFFLLMNVAVGGYWPGNPDETTEFPQEMIIDYVRVYQLAEA